MDTPAGFTSGKQTGQGGRTIIIYFNSPAAEMGSRQDLHGPFDRQRLRVFHVGAVVVIGPGDDPLAEWWEFALEGP